MLTTEEVCEKLRKELANVKSKEELDRHLREEGGAKLIPTEIFAVYLEEYTKRDWCIG